jgi:hypothetical protein
MVNNKYTQKDFKSDLKFDLENSASAAAEGSVEDSVGHAVGEGFGEESAILFVGIGLIAAIFTMPWKMSFALRLPLFEYTSLNASGSCKLLTMARIFWSLSK